MKYKMTYEFARAIALDEVNRQLRRERRKKWNIKDSNLYARKLNEILDKWKL